MEREGNPMEMNAIVNEPQEMAEDTVTDISLLHDTSEETSLATVISHPNPTTQLLLSSKLITHVPEAGLNPLVDAAAYLFSLLGKLKHVKTHRNLPALQQELLDEINLFRETAQAYSDNAEYISEYIPITCYALCVTFDDIIANTTWGGQGKWDQYSLVKAYTAEPLSKVSFFIILERLIRDPHEYIDVMEFMYLCLNFGFKCYHNANTEFDHEQLELITNSLYKRIRSSRGNFSKNLSPFSLKQPLPAKKKQWQRLTPRLFVLIVATVITLGATAVWIEHALKPTGI
jgi:type VI secretion system protein ImpK